MRYFRRDLRIETKPDNTPVTQADREAEALIRDFVSRRFPDHRFLGEEFGGSSPEMGYVWVIDPIDGTKNFIRGLPFFATQLALLHDGQVIVGVSYAPALDELMAAAHGLGATLNGRSVHVSGVARIEDAFLLHGGLDVFDQEGRLPALVALARRATSIRGHGDFYGYHLVAQGRVDAMLEASIHSWDVAACKLIVEEAGGCFTGLDGVEQGLPPDSIASNGVLHRDLVASFGMPAS
mgnify:CR=1 FL=1